MTSQSLQPLDHTEPWPRRRYHRGAVLALVVALVGVGWFASRLGADPPSSPPPRASASRPAGHPQAAGASGVVWEDFAGLDLPISSTAGPHLHAAGRAAGFEHSPTGAAFAAVHLLVRTFPFAGSAVFTPTIADQVDGPDAAALARLTRDAYAQVARTGGAKDGEPLRSEGGWVAGYRLDQPATDTADNAAANSKRTVRVLIRQVGEAGADGFTEYRVQLVWRDDDWRIIAPPWGDWRSAAVALSSADPARYISYDPGRS